MAKTRVLSFVGLVVTFAAAYGFERLGTYMRVQLGVNPSAALGKSIFWVESIALIILAAMLVLLAWYVVCRARRDIWVGVIFTVVGLVLTFVVAIDWSLESFWVYRRLSEFAVHKSYGHYVAAFVAVTGIASLALPRRRDS